MKFTDTSSLSPMFLADGNCIKVQKGWGGRHDEQKEGAIFIPGVMYSWLMILLLCTVWWLYLIDYCAMLITLDMVCNCLTLSSSQCQLLKITWCSVFLPVR
jgi:hypothetical protein